MTLDEAEVAMLQLYGQRAGLANGQNILELGCGWGSLSLWMAKTYPKAKITGVSNSRTQKEFIMARAQERGIKNLEIITADMVTFEPPQAGQYDRIVSIEMFEHMKNYDTLFERCTKWLKKGGQMFIHIFVQRRPPTTSRRSPRTTGCPSISSRWHVPSTGSSASSPRVLLKHQWRVSGNHYYKTCEDWLKKLDRNYKQAAPILRRPRQVSKDQVYVYWRLFFLSCAGMFHFTPDGVESR